MNALQKALTALQDAERYYEAGEQKGSDHYHDLSRRAYADAKAYAAVAQAQALERIAEYLDGILACQLGVGAEYAAGDAVDGVPARKGDPLAYTPPTDA